MNITKAQLKVLKKLQWCLTHEPYRPTLRELAQKVGITVTPLRKHLDKLQQYGYITRERRQARKIDVTDDGIGAIARSLLTPEQQEAFDRYPDELYRRDPDAFVAWLAAVDMARHGLWEDDDE